MFLVSLYKLIPIGKTFYLLRKTFKENVKGNTLNNIYNNKFNLPPILVPLIGLRRLIPFIEKTLT